MWDDVVVIQVGFPMPCDSLEVLQRGWKENWHGRAGHHPYFNQGNSTLIYMYVYVCTYTHVYICIPHTIDFF